MFRSMIKDAIETIYEGELTETLGYGRYERKSKKGAEKEREEDNARNGYGTKRAKSTFGEIDLSVPRDRNALYEPRIVPKRQKDISGIEETIISMYAKGMTTTDIQKHMESIYGLDFSKESIS
ncbi:transposase, partial [Persephonella sp.]|uniref:transposase n=1 Tax=Persephonella sp. TaxID=2060922 RepID=UPI0025DF63D6